MQDLSSAIAVAESLIEFGKGKDQKTPKGGNTVGEERVGEER